jgi:hypothetical protein
MKCEVTLLFEENDGTLKWLFNIIIYAHHISEPNVQKMLEPMLQEFLEENSYLKVMQLSEAGISEEELIQTHLHNGLIRFNNPTIRVRGQKIKAMCYMIEQAGAMQAAAAGEEVPAYILDLFNGHETFLGRIKQVVTEALEQAGAQGVRIDRFSCQ